MARRSGSGPRRDQCLRVALVAYSRFRAQRFTFLRVNHYRKSSTAFTDSLYPAPWSIVARGSDRPAAFKPKQIVAVHMPAGEPQRAAAQIQKRFPDAAAFTVLLEKKYLLVS
jgi:hypothetical protein